MRCSETLERNLLVSRTVEVLSHKVKNRLAAISAMVQMGAPKERVLQEIDNTVFTLDDMVAWGVETGEAPGCDFVKVSQEVASIHKHLRVVDHANVAGKVSPLSCEETRFLVEYLAEVVAKQYQEAKMTTKNVEEGFDVVIEGSEGGKLQLCEEAAWCHVAKAQEAHGVCFGLLLVRWILRRHDIILNVYKDEKDLLAFSFRIKESKT